MMDTILKQTLHTTSEVASRTTSEVYLHFSDANTHRHISLVG